MMDINHLRTFQVVAQLRSLTKAAAELNLSQPAATRHIQALERELGVSLIVHGKRPVQLTPAGSSIAQFTSSLIADLEQLKALAQGQELVGDVTIATTESLVSRQLLQAMRIFRDKFPMSKINVRSGTMSDLLDLVASSRADMGVIASYNVPTEFHVIPLFPVQRVLITPLGHPLLEEPLRSLAQLAPYPLILQQAASHPFTLRTSLEEAFRVNGIPLKIIGEFDRLELIKQAVAEGLGISVMNEMALGPFEHEWLGVLPLATLVAPVDAGIVTINMQSLKPIAKYFVDLLVENQHPMFQGQPHPFNSGMVNFELPSGSTRSRR